ncbi:LysR family transcriptional regulator [Paenibacillus sp. sptzw28]|uniref:LysR family transcriptional regulator n=1 Tax=Paenibacillus sp. sptzw28 TaxID=715179 RepID=UPI001C6F483D|nr:LysR family transcriptional regulator [Paenibacillus sp. sptzw28]QYR19410.1 LysR family transcriptional regulator [Paenibacillus sp. sptzw28]
MDLKTLKTFHLIVHYGSFVRAAEEMNYAQSTVTMQIQKLESDLGIQLIERGKNIRLTEAGRLFHEQSVQIVKNMERLQSSMSDLQLGEAGNIRLGVTEPSASYRLPGILERFLTRFPKIRISVDIGSTAALCERLHRGELDLALGSAPELGSGLYFEPLFVEQFVILIPDLHPLSSKHVITTEDIRGHRMLITSANCPYRQKLEIILQETGIIPLDTMEIGSMSALKYYVAAGLGIALVPNIILQPAPSGTIMRELQGNAINMTSGLLTKSSEYPLKLAGASLYQFLKRELLKAG